MLEGMVSTFFQTEREILFKKTAKHNNGQKNPLSKNKTKEKLH